MLTYDLTDRQNTPLYERIYRCIREDILAGRLGSGERLPSKRSFAKNNGISIITVENAYAQLMAEGYIYSLPKKGFYVSDIRLLPEPQSPIVRDTRPDAGSGARYAPNQGEGCIPGHDSGNNACCPLRHSADDAAVPVTADLTTGRTDTESFPFSTWSRLMRELLAEDKAILMEASEGRGVPALRRAIAEHLRAFHGMAILPDQVIIGAGTEYLYGLLVQLLGRDRVYGIEDPAYHKISQIYEALGVDCRYIPMDEEGMQPGPLREHGIDIAHISPSHQFPTGITMPIGRRYALLTWAVENTGRYIIEDDYDSEFRLTGQPVPTLMSIDRHERVIYVNTFTRTLSSTVRIAYMVLPPHLAALYREKLSFYSCTVSSFEQYTLSRFISRGHFEKHLNRMRNHYRKKQDRLLGMIAKSPLADRAEISMEDSGLHFLMRIDTDETDESFCGRAGAMGLTVSALSEYYRDPPASARHTLIIRYSALTEEAMGQAVDVLSALTADRSRRPLGKHDRSSPFPGL